MPLSLSSVYISMIQSYDSDCKNLLGKFKAMHSSDFDVFLDLWKELKFSLIYEKYLHHGFVQEFKDDTMHLARKYMINFDFVGGLYLIYGLNYIQSLPKVPIRLELDDFNLILVKLQEVLQNAHTFEPGYIVSRLIKSNAFSFVVFGREFSMENMGRARLIYGEEDKLFLAAPLHDRRRGQRMSLMDKLLQKYNIQSEEIRKVDEEYLKKIQQIKEDYPELNLSLGVVPQSTVEILFNDEVITSEEESAIPETIGQRRRRLKNKKIISKYGVKEEEKYVKKVSSKKPPNKKTGAPRGKRKSFVLKAINSPSDSECESSSHSDHDDGIRSLLPIL